MRPASNTRKALSIGLLVLFLTVLSGCGNGGVDAVSDTPETVDETSPSGGGEAAPLVENAWIKSTNGNFIFVRSKTPSASTGEKLPVIIIVPGGLGSSMWYLDIQAFAELADEGYIIYAFTPQGRGSGTETDPASEGVENYNGPVHQDDLKAVIEYAKTNPLADQDNIGVVSFSFGISMAAGCLGRDPGLNVKYLIDVEGPSDSYVIMADAWLLDSDTANDKTAQMSGMFGGREDTADDPSAENIQWWSEREALNYIGSVTSAYMRIQSEWDHMQPPNQDYQSFDYPPLWYGNKHAVDLLNAATNGSSVWTRMNGEDIGNPPNTLYNYKSQPAYYSGNIDGSFDNFSVQLKKSIKEMAGRVF